MNHPLFGLIQQQCASDCFISADAPLYLKINGTLVAGNGQKLTSESLETLLTQLLSHEQWQELQQKNELNVGLDGQELGRFRLSAFKQRGQWAAVLRHIPQHIPSLKELNLPLEFSQLALLKRGLVLVVGATGVGKSSTLAAMLEHRNQTMSGHILTVENPIEASFTNKQSVINQREVGSDTESLATALRNALRQAPDVLYIGEIRDKETMGLALQYAQSGHLVLSTLHANNSYHALNRIASFYPLEARAAMLQDLSSTLKAIVSQRLVMTLQNTRIPTTELLMNSQHIAELIMAGDMSTIKEAIDNSLVEGAHTFEQDLKRLVQAGSVSRDAALAVADSPSNLMWLLEQNSATRGSAAIQEQTKKNTTEVSFEEFTFN
jgi:twitching motility protein PilU